MFTFTDSAIRSAREFLGGAGLPPETPLEVDARDEMAMFLAERLDPDEVLVEYLRSGLDAAQVVERLAGCLRRPDGGPLDVLDFAAGFGRTTRHLARLGYRLTAGDIAPGTTEFLAERFGVDTVACHEDPARLEWARHHDLIWVGSLFSHLKAEDFAPLLVALGRALAPDGLLAFTTHPPSAKPSAAPAAEQGPAECRFQAHSESVVLDPQKYGTSYADASFVRRVAAEVGLRTVAHAPLGLWGRQDVHVVAHEGSDRGPIEAASFTPPQVSVARADRDARDWAWIGGFARVLGPLDGVAGLSVSAGSGARFPVQSRPHGSPLPGGLAEAGWHQLDWYVEGPLDPALPDPLFATANLLWNEESRRPAACPIWVRRQG